MRSDEWIGTVIRKIMDDTVLSKEKATLLWRNIKSGLPQIFHQKKYYTPSKGGKKHD